MRGNNGRYSLAITFPILVPKAPAPPWKISWRNLSLSTEPRLEARPGEGRVSREKVLRQYTDSLVDKAGPVTLKTASNFLSFLHLPHAASLPVAHTQHPAVSFDSSLSLQIRPLLPPPRCHPLGRLPFSLCLKTLAPPGPLCFHPCFSKLLSTSQLE